MSLSLKERFNYNFYFVIWINQGKMINFVSPRIVDIDDTKAVINVPLNIKTKSSKVFVYRVHGNC